MFFQFTKLSIPAAILLVCLLHTGVVEASPPQQEQEKTLTDPWPNKHKTSNIAAELTFPVGWQVDDEKTFRMTEATEGTQGSSKKVTDFTIRVIERNEDSVVLEMERLLPELDEATETPEAKKMKALFDGFKLQIEVGTDGIYRKIRNSEELATKVAEVKNIIRKIVDEMGLPEEEKERAWQAAMQKGGTPQIVEAHMTKGVQLLLSPLGSVHSPKPYLYEDYYAGQQGKSIPAIAAYRLGDVDSTKEIAVLWWDQKIDRTEERAQSEKAQQAARTIELPPEEIEMSSSGKFIVNYKTGWPQRAETTLTVKFTGFLVEHDLTIEAIEPNSESGGQ